MPINLRPPGLGYVGPRTDVCCRLGTIESPLGSAPAVAHAMAPCTQGTPARSPQVGSLCVVYRGKAPPCLGAPDLVGGTSKSSRRMEGWDARLGAATGNAGNKSFVVRHTTGARPGGRCHPRQHSTRGPLRFIHSRQDWNWSRRDQESSRLCVHTHRVSI